MPPKFGTSGLRGLVTELTPDLVADHVRAFAAACDTGTGLYVGRDLRPSSPDLAETVLTTARSAGLDVTDCGAVPTPALAFAAMQAGAAAIMITGSHIPADRNGIKFYTPSGEITKAQEQAILAALGRTPAGQGTRTTRTDVAALYADRYRTGFDGTLKGLRIGIYQHSTVIRDLMTDLIGGLGAEAVPLGRSDTFIPVDTEAVDAATRAQIADWTRRHSLDALISADGDADRPLLADADGDVVPGDILGPLTAAALGAERIVTPVSSNTMAQLSGRFAEVSLTRIGSPYVIARMEELGGNVAGYEANGGFLLGFAAQAPTGPLPPLMTRDCLLPILAPLAEARRRGGSLKDLIADWPARRTASDRLQNVPTEASKALIAHLSDDPSAFLAPLGQAAATNRTDGLRITLTDGRILHLRPSGNAPELRCYAEADTTEAAAALRDAALKLAQEALDAT
ncbi:phosphomannomutase [Aestuariibius sp. 2305UL40-4]|uniref:phosphomannomutase n=1 Tax=Aestuariibius violaceus TaxID=3234132 RepID=UPI00345ED63B